MGAHDERTTQGPAADDAATRPFRAVSDGAVGRPGDRFGRYRLIAELGEGGFGVVWRAEQTEPVRREVALKIIKPGMDSRAVIARFEAERQALAVMDHECIARVLDGGAAGPESPHPGLPYFVMELVRGEPITDFCDRHRLGIRDRLTLFARVCGAVQHAHSKGVIHRDLKPGNVLVGYDGEQHARPKVIDFGIAKALNQQLTERTLFTERGQLIGTPEYMSPEQAEMTAVDIDTRSDVYSLGVLLYELLTGTLPFDPRDLRSKGFGEIQRIIREVEPPRPSTRLGSLPPRAATGGAASSVEEVATRRSIDARTLSSTLRRDLDWVVMKCLEKDRSRRYGTAAELADEVARFLAHEPVLAGPPSAAYRAQKFVRRHRAGLAVAALVATSLVGGLAASVVMYRRSETQRREAQRQYEIARAVNEFLNQDLLTAATTDDRGISLTVFEAARAAAARVEGKFKDPLVESSVRRTLGEVFRYFGESERAEEQLRRAISLAVSSAGPDSPAALDAKHSLGATLVRAGRRDEGEPLLRDELEARVRAGDNDAALAAMLELANAYCVGNRTADFDALAVRALDLCSRAFGDDHHTAAWLHAQALHLTHLSRQADSAPLFERALDIRLRTRGPDAPDTLETMYQLSAIRKVQGRPEDRERLLAECLAARRRTLGPSDPLSIRTARQLAEALREGGRAEDAARLEDEIARIDPLKDEVRTPSERVHFEAVRALEEQGRHEELERVLVEYLGWARGHFGEASGVTQAAARSLADFYVRRARLDDAGATLEASIDAITAARGGEHPDLIPAAEALAELRSRQNRHDAAADLYLSAAGIAREAGGRDDPRSLRLMSLAADDLEKAGGADRAEPIRRNLLEACTRLYGPKGDESLAAMASLAACLVARGNPREAEEIYRRHAALVAEMHPEDSPALTWARGNVAWTLALQHKDDEALPLFEEVLGRKRAEAGDADDHTLWTLLTIGNLSINVGNFDRADSAFSEGLETTRRAFPRQPGRLFWPLRGKADVCRARGDRQGEEKYLLEACAAAKAATPPDAAGLRAGALALAALYDAADKPDEAAKWRAVILELDRHVPDAKGPVPTR